MPKNRRNRSLLHRILGITPGKAPKYLCSRNNCSGFDAISALESFLLVLAFAIWKFTQSYSLSLFVVFLLIGFVFCLDVPFRSCERKFRARIRRGECMN